MTVHNHFIVSIYSVLALLSGDEIKQVDTIHMDTLPTTTFN